MSSESANESITIPVEDPSDLFQRHSNELQRNDLAENFKVVICVEAVSGLVSLRLQQTDPVVVMKGPDGYTRQLCELV